MSHGTQCRCARGLQKHSLATDFSEVSQHALLQALALAKRFDAKLTVVHVAPPEAQAPIPMEPVPVERRPPPTLVEYGSGGRQLWCKPQVLVEIGVAPELITRTAQDRHVDLIVMGVHPAGTFARHLPWTVLHLVVRRARCPVLTVRGGKADAE